MSSRNWLNLGLLTAFVLLAALAFYDEAETPGEQLPRLSDLDPASLTRFRIERPDGANLEFEKITGAWRVTAPYEADADDQRVKSLLNVLTAPSFTRFAAEANKLAQYKLQPPLASLIAGGTRFDFGDTDPLNKRRYVLNANQVHLLADNQFPLLLTAPYVLTSTRLLPENGTPVEIRLATHTLRRDAQSTWQIEPAIDGLDKDALERLAEDWRLGRALRVSAPDASQAAWHVGIKLQDGRQYRFGVIKRDPELLLVRDDQALRYHFALNQGHVLIDAPRPPRAETP